jgi:hypothetical protein
MDVQLDTAQRPTPQQHTEEETLSIWRAIRSDHSHRLIYARTICAFNKTCLPSLRPRAHLNRTAAHAHLLRCSNISRISTRASLTTNALRLSRLALSWPTPQLPPSTCPHTPRTYPHTKSAVRLAPDQVVQESSRTMSSTTTSPLSSCTRPPGCLINAIGPNGMVFRSCFYFDKTDAILRMYT